MVQPPTEVVARPERWDEPLDPSMSEADVDRILTLEPFRSIDETKFPDSLPLRGIIRNDFRIRRFQHGDIVIRQGDYGNTAFFVLEGLIRVVLGGGANELSPEVLGRAVSKKKNVLEALRQLWQNATHPEVRQLLSAGEQQSVGRRASGEKQDVRIFLQDVPRVLGEHRTATLEAGEFFGEIAALGRTPRTTTVFAEGDAQLLEIRWQGLRDIRRRSERIRQHIDTLYRENSLRSQLRATAIFGHLNTEDMTRVADETVFETYGNFDWVHSHKKLSEKSYAERLAYEPVIAEEGHYPNGVVLVRAGFARLSRKFRNGHRTLSYLGKGHVYGFEEIVHNWKNREQIPYRSSLNALGYVDTLLVPTHIMETLVLPTMPAEWMPPAVDGDESESESESESVSESVAPQPWLEFIGEKRLVNGTAAMVIDLDQCVRCDDCVRGCAAAHDGNPRFVRSGPRHGSLQVANACMHCVDPVCMIGCPTGAIHRSEEHGEILINDSTCIGCATCSESCPYDNIRMVEIRDTGGRVLLDGDSNPIAKATKCDLCLEQPSGPACVMACAHDALRRVDLNEWSKLTTWRDR